MPETTFPLVDASEIARLVGKTAFERGQAYFRQGAVLDVLWNAEARALSGQVQGSGLVPYTCSVTLGTTGRGFRPIFSMCDCPVGSDCKHVAAALVYSNARAMAPLVAATTQPEASGAQPDAVADWRSVLGGPAAATTTTLGSDGRGVPMALQFELRERVRRTHDRWRGPASAAASPRSSAEVAATRRLGVRPVVRSASTGAWVRNNLTWGTFMHQANRMNLDPEHHRWFAEFAAVQRASRATYTGQELDWIYLDEFASPLLWHLLDEAARLGIELVGPKKDASITLAREASVGLDASAHDGGSLTLTTRVTFDDSEVGTESVGQIGDHGLYSFGLSPHLTVALAPLVSPLSTEQRRLLGDSGGSRGLGTPETPGALEVPAAEVPEFFETYYPRLRRSLPVTSSDDSVPLPEAPEATLVLTATFEPRGRLRISWGWRYGAGAILPLQPTSASEAGVRDEAAEERILSLLSHTLTVRGWGGADPSVAFASRNVFDGVDAAQFVVEVLDQIDGRDDVVVETVGQRPDYVELTETPELTVTTVETDKRDWFDLGIMVTVEGRTIPFGPLFTALSKGKKKLKLVDNSYLSLEQPVFERLLELIEEARTISEWQTDTPRISRYQASLWADFEDLAEETIEASSWRAAVSGLNAVEGVEAVAVPDTVRAQLRPYQHEGFSWLAFLYAHGLGGILADDMGLGKTLQTLALVAHARAADAPTGPPFLVVAPTSVVSNWVAEATRFTPHLVVRSVTATEAKSKKTVADAARGADILITSYALFRLDFAAYKNEQWAGLILDEAQFIKNHTSRIHTCARDLPAPFKLAITGTPMENNLLELWSLFAITAPGLFASSRRFTEDYVRPIDRGENRELLARLRRRIRPLMMRRTKQLVAPELPDKQEQELQIELAPAHRKLYDVVLQRERQKLLGLIDDLDKNRFIVFRSITLLRMLSLDASLIDEKYANIPSSKLDALFEQLDDVVAEGHRALVFSQFTTFLHKAAARLEAAGIPYAYLDGSSRKRKEIIDGFKDGEAPVFLISLKAGGFGLNLTEADYVFLLDPWWNPASESQAIDRTHRIGQTKNVMVYRLVAAGTIEEKVMALKAKKAELTDAVLDDEGAFGQALTADDIRGLLEA
ncbi:DEAD/DEAH box helicase [Agreia sp. COWG]|uniref:DEAD/DEAH box helicase n=1 Tax=Agreia sp. COWG TaxID=2773266 RepID=UPI001928FA17|nr:DEAD/DEAH box helicase [Agreia sp. COWG]